MRKPSRLWILAAAALCLLACAEPAATASPDATTAAEVTAAAACHPQQQRPTGACCPPGAAYDFKQNDCLPVGPPECATLVFANPQACVPKWCGDWRDGKGGSCPAESDGCTLVGRLCTPAELAAGQGCPAGAYPARTDPNRCVVVGSDLALPSGITLEGIAPPADGSLPQLPDIPELPALPSPPPPTVGRGPPTPFGLPLWCPNADGSSRACAPDEPGCPPGYEPDPGNAAQCKLLMGVDWVCPPGFVAQKTVDPQSGLPTCAPNPADCGPQSADPFGWMPDAPGTIYVDAAAAAGGNGTRKAPFAKIMAAVVKAKAGGSGATVAVAAGSYVGTVVVDGAVHLRGRCAAMVHLSGPIDKATFVVAGPGVVLAEGLSIDGGLPGLLLQKGGKAQVVQTLVNGAVNSGIVATEGSALTLTNVVVSATKWNAVDGDGGQGIYVIGASKVSGKQLRVVANHDGGIVVVGAGSTFSATGLVVDGTSTTPKQPERGAGLVVGSGATASVSGGRFVANTNSGITTDSAGASVSLRRVVVAATRPAAATQLWGVGVQIAAAATVQADQLRLAANRRNGLRIVVGGIADVRAALIHDTVSQLHDNKYGEGIRLGTGSTLDLTLSRVANNIRAGIAVVDADSKLTADQCLVDHTVGGSLNPTTGYGAYVTDGASAALVRSRFAQDEYCGLLVSSGGATAVLRDIVIDHILPRPGALDYGRGLAVQDGATVDATRLRIVQCNDIAVFISGSGARLNAQGLAVSGTRPKALSGTFGFGLGVQAGAAAVLVGVRLLDGFDRGASFIDAKGSMTGVSIANVAPRQSDSANGSALAALNSALVVTALRADQSHSAAAAIFDSGLTMVSAVLTGTKPAKVNVKGSPIASNIADGLIASGAKSLTLDQILVVNNERAGIFVVGAPLQPATLAHALVTGGVFGIVTQAGGMLGELATAVFGNSVQNRASDLGLAVPEPPTLANAADDGGG